MFKDGISKYTIMGIVLYLIIFIIDRFIIDINEIIYISVMMVSLTLLIIGLILRSKR